MAVNEMGDPIDMEEEDEYDGDEKPIDGEELNALMDALKENRQLEVSYVDAHLLRAAGKSVSWWTAGPWWGTWCPRRSQTRWGSPTGPTADRLQQHPRRAN